MPDIADREKLEKRLARLINEATEPLRERLIAALGDPPDVANIPDDLWEEVEAAIEENTKKQLALLFLLGVGGMTQQFGVRIDADKTGERAIKAATKQVRQLASSIVDTTRQRLDTAATDARERLEQAQERVEAHRREAADIAKRPEPREADESSEPGGAGPAPVKQPPGEVPRIPSRKEIEQELSDRLDEIHEQQADAAGVTETTAANSAGEHHYAKEVEKDRPGGKFIGTWNTVHDGGACKICAPLDNSVRGRWERVAPDGPPAHPNCRCWLTWEWIGPPLEEEPEPEMELQSVAV